MLNLRFFVGVRRLDDPMPPSAALFGKQKKARSKLRLTLLFVLSVLFALADATERKYDAVDTEQHKVCADDVSNRRNRDVRTEYHHDAEHKSDNVDNHREPVDEIARDEPNRVQVREPRETVRDEPYREQE